MARRLPGGTVTFLFTDVEGSTSLLHTIGSQAYARALADHRQIVRAATARWGGVEVDTQGDAFFIAFADAGAAVAVAAEVTEELDGGPISVRMGLHTGEPVVTDEGYVGDDVHLGARIAAAGHGGQVLLSATTATLVVDQPLEVLPLGEHRFKDYPKPIGVFQLGTHVHPPLRTISNSNLPRPPSSFVGRVREMAALAETIAGGTRVVTLTGPGGSGKTRLAIEAAHRLVPRFPAGVFWIGLASVRDHELVGGEIARTIGATWDLAEWIGERTMMLVVDNLEQVIDAAADLAALATRCPNLVLLVTSRERMRIGGEVELSVPPLSGADGIALFSDRSGLEPSPAMEQLTRRLDHQPLSLELAAARARAFTIDELLERLGDRLDFLVGGRDVDRRQATLRATIDWSHDLLADAERRLFRRLAVFAWDASLDGIERVTAGDLGTLQSLVEKSLVRADNGRYRMLETIRAYAAERLAAAEERAGTYEALAAFIESLAATVPRMPVGDNRAPAHALEPEEANVRVALGYLHETGQHNRLLELTSSIGGLWALGGSCAEGRRWIEIGLALADPSPELRADAVDHACDLAFFQGDYDAVRAYCLENLAYYRGVGDLRGTAFALIGLGLTSIETDRPASLRYLADARSAAVAAGAHAMVARIDGNLGWMAMCDGDLEGGREQVTAAADALRALGNAADLRPTLANLAQCEARLGRIAAMRSVALECLESAVTDGDRHVLAALALLGAWLDAPPADRETRCELLAAAEAELERLGIHLADLDADMHRRAREDVIGLIGADGLAVSRERSRAVGILAVVPLLRQVLSQVPKAG